MIGKSVRNINIIDSRIIVIRALSWVSLSITDIGGIGKVPPGGSQVP